MVILNETVRQSIEQNDVLIVREMHRFFDYNKDFVFPHIILTLILSGTARAKYDMRVFTHQKNDLTIIFPGHVLHPLDCSDDFSYALVFISQKMLDDLRFHTFSHNQDNYNHTPICSLTDQQAAHLLSIVEQLDVIAKHTDKELPHRYQTLLAQLAVGYEFVNYYRKEVDHQWAENRYNDIFSSFCDLVVNHHRESKEVQYYADLLNITPKHLSKVIHSVTNGLSPLKWIEEYVIGQAKRLIEANTAHTLQEIAFMLGFNEPSSFYRYFKRVAGMTAKQYRNSLPNRKV